jgi:hypothetical protein
MVTSCVKERQRLATYSWAVLGGSSRSRGAPAAAPARMEAVFDRSMSSTPPSSRFQATPSLDTKPDHAAASLRCWSTPRWQNSLKPLD